MTTARSAKAVLAALFLAALVVGGCSRNESTTQATDTTTATDLPVTTTSAAPTTSSATAAAPAMGDPLSVTCARFTTLDKASQLKVIIAIFGSDPAKNNDRVSLASMMCMSQYVQDKTVQQALPGH